MNKKRTLTDDLKSLSVERRKKIEARAKELISEELTLQELRKAKKQSQKYLAEKLHVKQSEVSKLERRTDMYISSLRNYVHAMGGTLHIEVRFPRSRPVKISQFADDRNQNPLEA